MLHAQISNFKNKNFVECRPSRASVASKKIFEATSEKRPYSPNANIGYRNGGDCICVWGTRPLRPSCRFPLYSGSSSRGSWYNLVINSYQIPPERQNHLPPNLSNFMTEHLFQGLCADAPAHCEAYSASPSPIIGCKGGSWQEGMEEDY